MGRDAWCLLEVSWERGPGGSLQKRDGGAIATLHKALAYLLPAPAPPLWLPAVGGAGPSDLWRALCPSLWG